MPYKLNIHHIDVGQGDATLIILKNDEAIEKAILIDAGGSLRKNVNIALSQRVATFCLNKLSGREGRREGKPLDAIIVSHYDMDHVGGFRYFEEYAKLWNAFMTKDTKIYTPIESSLKQGRLSQFVKEFGSEINVVEKPVFNLFADLGFVHSAIKMSCLAANCLIDDGSGRYTEYKGNCKDGSLSNRISLAFLIEIDGFQYYTGGDIGSTQEEAFAERIGYINSFKVSHHASKTSTPKMLTDRCMPGSSAIVSYGHNRHRHPTAEIVDRILLNVHIAKTYFTGQLDQNELNEFLKQDIEHDEVVWIGEDQLNIHKLIEVEVTDYDKVLMVAPGVISIKVSEGERYYDVNYDRFDKKREADFYEDFEVYPKEFTIARNSLYEMFLALVQHDIREAQSDEIPLKDQQTFAMEWSAELAHAINSNEITDMDKLRDYFRLNSRSSEMDKELLEIIWKRCHLRISKLLNVYTLERKTRGYFFFDGKLSYINKMTDSHRVFTPRV